MTPALKIGEIKGSNVFLPDNTWNSWEDSIPPLLMILHLQLDSIIILIPEGRWFPRRWFCKGFCQGGESERRRRKHHQRPADGDCSHCLRVICVFWKKRYTNIRQACVNKTNWLLTDAQSMWLNRYIFLIFNGTLGPVEPHINELPPSLWTRWTSSYKLANSAQTIKYPES